MSRILSTGGKAKVLIIRYTYYACVVSIKLMRYRHCMSSVNVSSVNMIHVLVCNSYNTGMNNLPHLHSGFYAYILGKSQVPML